MTAPASRLDAALYGMTGIVPQPGPEFVERMDADMSNRLCTLVEECSYAWRDWQHEIACQARDEAAWLAACREQEAILARMKARGLDTENPEACVEELAGVRWDHTGIAGKVIADWEGMT